jgi:GTP cyclohydrolase I
MIMPGVELPGDLEHHIAQILNILGYDLEDQHFRKTPERMAKWLRTFHKNAGDEEAHTLLDIQFDEEHDSLVVVGPTTVRSMCAHHGLPVVGRAWAGYIPQGKVVGLSKLSRIVHHYAAQFTIQERVTQQIANLLWAVLEPLGVMVVIKAEHGCMTLRGVLEPDALTTTSAVRGVFKEEEAARTEFLRLVDMT